VAEADVGRFGRFWLAAPEEVLIPAWLELMVTHVGVMTLLEASSRSLCIRRPQFLLWRETLDPLDWVMEVLVCVFILLWGIISESNFLGDR
jgi:hypothetical protein